MIKIRLVARYKNNMLVIFTNDDHNDDYNGVLRIHEDGIRISRITGLNYYSLPKDYHYWNILYDSMWYLT